MSENQTTASPTNTIGDSTDANFPVDGENRVYHLGVKSVANRVLSVGDPNRAKLLVDMLDNPKTVFQRISNRGFNSYTGKFQGKPVTIMSIGMGMSMMDFMVREAKHVVKGPMRIIRLGTCGTPSPTVSVGSIAVAKHSRRISINPDLFLEPSLVKDGEGCLQYYTLSLPVSAGESIHSDLCECLSNNIDTKVHPVVEGLDITGDSFYSSQGRQDPNFLDHNETLVDELVERYSDITSLQMETFQLYFLSQLSVDAIDSVACAIVLAQRKSNAFLSNDTKHDLEVKAGRACLETLAKWEIDETKLLDDDSCVWNQQ